MENSKRAASIESVLSERARRESAMEITWLMKETLDKPDLISLAVGFVDQVSLPREETAEIVAALLADSEKGLNSLQYGTTIGLESLREEIAHRLGEQGLEGIVTPDDILVTNGSQQLLFIATEVLADPGDIVLVENPTYFAYAAVLKGAAVRAVGIRTDDDGIIPEALESTLEKINRRGELNRVKLLYIMSYFSNPRGTSFSWERRCDVYNIIHRFSRADRPIFIIEDVAYRELKYEGPDIPYLKSLDKNNEDVILAGSFSKSFAPGLRTGFAAIPPRLMPHIICQKSYQDFGSPSFLQYVIAEALKKGLYDRHVEELRKRYRMKRDLALEAIANHWPENVRVNKPLGGMYLWARVPDVISTDLGSELFTTALNKENVLYIPGSLCYVGALEETIPRNEMRICYGMIDDDKLVEGLKRLGNALHQVMR